MATFSEGFLSQLGRPAMSQSLFDLGSAIGGVPGQMKQQRKQQEFNQLIQQIQGAQGSGDFTSMKILAQQLAPLSPQEADKVMQAAVALEQKQGQEKALEGLFDLGESITPEAYMAAGQKALAAGDTETALALRDKAQGLSETEATRQAETAAIQQELQGYMTNPKASPEVKRMANQIYRGFVGGGMQPAAISQQLAALRDLAKPKAVGSRAAPIFKDLMRPNPQTGQEEKRTIRFDRDPVTGAPIETDVGRPVPEESAPDSVRESVKLLDIEDNLIGEVRDLSSKALRAEELAANFEKYDPVGGLQGSFIEFAKEVSGQQDVISALRTEASRLTTGAAVAALPKGPASDKDIALVLRGVPPANAGAEYFASYARGVAKMQKAEAQYKREQLNWLSKKRSYEGFNAHMTRKKVQEQFAATDPIALREMEANIDDSNYRRSFIKNIGYDYVQYKQELEDANAILGDL